MARVTIEQPQRILFHTDVPIRISDINYGNHLGHDSLVSMLHEARVRFLSSLGMTELDADGRMMVVVELSVVYLAEAHHGDMLRIEIGAGEVRSRSYQLLYQVRSSGTGDPIARARTGIVVVDPDTRRPAALPERLRQQLQEG